MTEPILTARELVERARVEYEELCLVGSHGTASGVWYVDLVPEDLKQISELIWLLGHAVEQADLGLRKIRDAVDEQAEDDGLWSVPVFGQQPIAEAYLQQELRRLHSVIEILTTECPHEWTTFDGPVVTGQLCLICMAVRASVEEEVSGSEGEVSTDDATSDPLTPKRVDTAELALLAACQALEAIVGFDCPQEKIDSTYIGKIASRGRAVLAR